jgi:flagellin-like hook-associated protein FlgL
MPGNLKNKDYPMISLMTNVDSLVAQQNLNVNSQFQSNTIDQLTSGYRINSSADDAAGLSVANGYRNQIAELNQGVLNANQGVSQLQIVDGGLSNISQMLDRLQTLATESASQTFTGNRGTLETEYSGLLGEIDRQADNVGLGDTNKANSANLSVYIGGGQSAQQNSSVSVDLAGSSVSSLGLGLAGTGVLDTPPATLGSTAATLIASGSTDSFTVATASGSQTISVTGAAGDSIAGQVTELNNGLAAYGITASLNSSNELQFQSASAFSVTATTAGLTASGDKAVNTGLNNAEYSTVTSGDALTITSGSQTASVTLSGTGQTAVSQINAALTSAGITGVSAVVDVGNSGSISLQGSSSFSTTITGTGTIAATTTPTGTGGDPTSAINAITQAVQNLGTVQGIVGAGENKLNYAISLATSQITNFSAAQSQIRDANVAQEAANLTQSQVIEQASIAAMAQANQEPQAILKLLQQ